MSAAVVESPKILVKLKDRQKIAEGTFAFSFEKPANFMSGEDIAQAVIDIYRYPGLALVSRIEIRPFQPPRKA